MNDKTALTIVNGSPAATSAPADLLKEPLAAPRADQEKDTVGHPETVHSVANVHVSHLFTNADCAEVNGEDVSNPANHIGAAISEPTDTEDPDSDLRLLWRAPLRLGLPAAKSGTAPVGHLIDPARSQEQATEPHSTEPKAAPWMRRKTEELIAVSRDHQDPAQAASLSGICSNSIALAPKIRSSHVSAE